MSNANQLAFENAKSRAGASSKEEGPVSSLTLWGAAHELAGMMSGQSTRPEDDVALSVEETDKLRDSWDAHCGNHLKPLVADSLKECITIAASNVIRAEWLLDEADQVNEDLEHLDKQFKALETAPPAQQSGPRNGLQARTNRRGWHRRLMLGLPPFGRGAS